MRVVCPGKTLKRLKTCRAASSRVLTGDRGAAVALRDAEEGVGRREALRRLEQLREARVQLARAHGRAAHRRRRRRRLLAVRALQSQVTIILVAGET